MSRIKSAIQHSSKTSCIVLHINNLSKNGAKRSPSSSLIEACGLGSAIDLDIIATKIITIRKPDPKSLIRAGIIRELQGLVNNIKKWNTGTPNTIVFFDTILSPAQQQNLEKSLYCKIIDRTALILEIFGSRAHTREGILQVNLAALTYQRSRLVRSWTHLERQRGSLSFVGGPGETQIESDRRLLSKRINKIKNKIKEISQTRNLHRKARRNIPYSIVALVGYTNSGKSTLFNQLTGASVGSRNQLFATLDPTMREVRLPSGQSIILSDTVGFVSNLPHELISAFHATLEEVIEADFIIHVRDAVHPDCDIQHSDVSNVLQELGVEQKPTLEIFNKIDLLSENEREVLTNQLKRAQPSMTAISALTGLGCDNILSVLDKHFTSFWKTFNFKIPFSDGAAIAWLYKVGSVQDQENSKSSICITVSLLESDKLKFQKKFGIVGALIS